MTEDTIILKCFAFQYQQEEQRVIYITESVTDSLIESFASVGVVTLSVVRKILVCLLSALHYLHEESPLAPLIHGHLQCHNILFVRSDGSVRLGGYAWMCRAMDTVNYDFPGRARKDSDLVVG
ncbi:hypothetical protein WA538_001237 [Blastocystis sp. DL]